VTKDRAYSLAACGTAQSTDPGKWAYLLSPSDGKLLRDIEQRMVLLSVADFKSGRRYVKSLVWIEVKRAE